MTRQTLSSALMCVLLALGLATTARAVDEAGQLENPALQSRYENLTKELRCLVCQNESVADSNAFLARDLRKQVQEMLVAGKTDTEILDFMTARYGEFVRYNPPLETKTVLLWGSPFILVVVGLIVIFRVMRNRSRMPLDDDADKAA